ncbi:MAG: circadian clock protein KaiC [Spirochaetia bacterium]
MSFKINKSSTGVDGLDSILRGGIPTGRTALVHGSPGTGKTILGLQFLLANIRAADAAIFISFEEEAASLKQNARSLDWDLDALEKENKLALLDLRPDPSAVLSGDFDVSGMLALIEGTIKRINAKYLVIDAIDILLKLIESEIRMRNQVYLLHSWLLERNLTTFITAKIHRETVEFPFLEFAVDCVLRLYPRNTDNQCLLHVLKYRGSDFAKGQHPYTICSRGIVMNPLVRSEIHFGSIGEYVSSGFPDLDSQLGGGYRLGSAVFLSGASGTGKTLFASKFAEHLCKDGKKVLYINFEEPKDSMIALMSKSGIDLASCVEKELLVITSRLPEAWGPEEHLNADLDRIKELKPEFVVIDAVSACARMGSQKAGFSYIIRIILYCKRQSITLLLTSQTGRARHPGDLDRFGISSLIDTIISLDYVPIGGEVNRTCLVVKSRGAHHSNQYREFVISERGVRFLDVYTGTGGMLTGVARQEQELREEYERRQRKRNILEKEEELEFLRSRDAAQRAEIEAQVRRAETELVDLKHEAEISLESDKQRKQMRSQRQEAYQESE